MALIAEGRMITHYKLKKEHTGAMERTSREKCCKCCCQLCLHSHILYKHAHELTMVSIPIKESVCVCVCACVCVCVTQIPPPPFRRPVYHSPPVSLYSRITTVHVQRTLHIQWLYALGARVHGYGANPTSTKR